MTTTYPLPNRTDEPVGPILRQNVRILRGFLPADECAALRDWISSLAHDGSLKANAAGPNRFYTSIYDLRPNQISNVLLGVDARLQARFGLTGKCLRLTDSAPVHLFNATPSFVGMQTNAGAVHPHIDDNGGGLLQFRGTSLISKPGRGGQLVIDGTLHEMAEGDMYCFVSNQTVHGTTPVEGDRPRMSASLGYLVEPMFRMDQWP